MTVLPIRVAPAPYEAWPGYLARVASTLHCRTEDLGAQLGLRTTGRWPAHHGITLDPARTLYAATALGLHPSEVTAMHLQRWDGIALDSQAITHARPRPWPLVPLSWTYLARPRPCATCHLIGHEDLHHYLPWIAHCTRHATPPTTDPPGSSQPARRLHELLEAGTAIFAGESVPARVALRSWLEAAILIAASHGRQDWRTPPTAAEAAHWLDEAAAIAAAPSYYDARDAIQRILEQRADRAIQYTRPQLYGAALRNLIDDTLASWRLAVTTASPPSAAAH